MTCSADVIPEPSETRVPGYGMSAWPTVENGLTVPDEPVSLPWQKEALDKVLSGFILLLTSPVWVLIWFAEVLDSALVRADSGPVLYTETRYSSDRPFTLLKFRIMKVDVIKERIVDGGEPPKNVENTPGALTVVGVALKKTGLDELPQFLNILRGDMSIVGPRPKPGPEYRAEIDAGLHARKVVRAGLTGPGQLLKGTTRVFEDDARANVGYVDAVRSRGAWGLVALDLGIIARTVRLMLKMTGE